ncbi:hypothetical protein DFH06DRAFT_1128710 [Mycena polygramma]|nr:hypothetical protein DFH06DRAFT_1128710 [Mycena polygramma]
MFRARPGLKAAAWARLKRAWASDFQSPSPSPQPGLQSRGPGPEPGLFRARSASVVEEKKLHVQAAALRPGSGFEILKPKPWAGSSPAQGPARLSKAAARLCRLRASSRALNITRYWILSELFALVYALGMEEAKARQVRQLVRQEIKFVEPIWHKDYTSYVSTARIHAHESR